MAYSMRCVLANTHDSLYDNMWVTPATTLSQWTGYSGVLPIDYIL